MEYEGFTFIVIPNRGRVPSTGRSTGYLLKDNWNDFSYTTLFILFVFDEGGESHRIGEVKIGRFGMPEGEYSPEISDTFTSLGECFFSLGQDDSYYIELNKLGEELRDHVLKCLGDVVADAGLFEKAKGEQVTKVSLLRSVSPKSVSGQFRRLAQGDARLTPYKFKYVAPKRRGSDTPPVTLSFEVEPESQPPTNIHVLIGQNGVGKTYLLNQMTQALLAPEESANKFGSFSSLEEHEGGNPFTVSSSDEVSKESLFANLVSVTFSAFDPFEALPEKRDKLAGLQYSYVGLKRSSNRGKEIGTPKSPDMLAREFAKSARACQNGARGGRWRKALATFEADPILSEDEVAGLTDVETDEEFEKRAASIFKKLSSGQKIVLLTTTRLVETMEERSLVLLDEPEAHLHPPLLSAFIRALSNLLVNRNGVAIIATHSPVVLQEVPRSCVWTLRRVGDKAICERPEIETFGENVGVLTRAVFHLELSQAGFQKILEDAVRSNSSYEEAVSSFGDQLGAEARAVLRAMFFEHKSKEG